MDVGLNKGDDSGNRSVNQSESLPKIESVGLLMDRIVGPLEENESWKVKVRKEE